MSLHHRFGARLKNTLIAMYEASCIDCRKTIIELAEPSPRAVYLDCGCDDGSFTVEVAARLGTGDVSAIEVSAEAADLAEQRGIRVWRANLDDAYPLESSCYDVVTASQVIEHVADTDHFLREIHRILRPGGYVIVATNNLASWHNVAALILGYQPFPSDVSDETSIGKAVAIFHGEAGPLAHRRVFTYPALSRMLIHHGFSISETKGTGYYPLPAFVGNRLAQVDKRHCAYLTVKAIKQPLVGRREAR